jgi:glycosyltransferase involved in cell wall biosynthesis
MRIVGRTLTVSMLTGVVVQRDAISNVCRQQVDGMARYARANGLRVSIKVYTPSSTVPDSRFAIAADPASVAVDPHFLESDVIVYQFGIYNPLFDSIYLVPAAAKKVVCYYGITPPGLFPPQQQALMHQSYRQAVNLHAADQVLVTSRYLLDELVRIGIPLTRIVQVPLWPSFNRVPEIGRNRPLEAPLRLLYVGRFVRAKGVHDLLQAYWACVGRDHRQLELDLVGSLTYSDAEYVEQLQGFVAEHRLAANVRFHFDVPEARLVECFREADALVVPSYHEGFSVPVIEGMTCGCFVICSDAGSLPETSGGLGRSYPVRDTEALCARLEEFIEARRQDGFITDFGFLTSPEWQARVAEHLAEFAPARSQQKFCDALFGDLDKVDDGIRRQLGQVQRRMMLGLRERPIQPPEMSALQTHLAEALAAVAAKPAA